MALYVTPTRLVNKTTATTATGNSGWIDCPIASSYMIILDAGAGTGTTPTLDVAIQVSPDDGTTAYTVGRYAQITTSATKSFKMVRNGLAYGEAGFVQAIADTGGAVDKNFVMTRKIRILYTIGGTNPSYATLVVWLFPQSPDLASR